MSKLVANIYHYSDIGGEVAEKIICRHPLADPSHSAILNLFKKSKKFECHPSTKFGAGKTTDGYEYIASVFSSKDGITRCRSASYRVSCKQKEN